MTALASPIPASRPSTAETRPTRTASTITDSEHLTTTGADGPQQGELAGPLGEQDGEGVRDHEHPDDERDQPEDGERLLEEGEARLHVVGDLGASPPRR